MFSTRDLSGFVCSAAEAVQLKFVRNVSQLGEEGVVIQPQFTHQVFGDKETVFGYENLKITVSHVLAHSTAQYIVAVVSDICVDITYDDTVSMDTHGVKPDNIFTSLDEWLPKGYYTSLDKFSIVLSQQRPFAPPGHHIHSYTSHSGTSCLVYKASLGHHGVKKYLLRLQPLLLWFIEAASYIDEEDEKWQFYLVYRQDREAGIDQYSLLAFASVYMFYCYPDRRRARISQMLVLPQYQKQGHGAELLQEVCSDLRMDAATYDITVEDPTETFVRLRDFIDCQNALRLPEFQPPSIHGPFQGAILRAARDTLKLHKTQARRVYEILRLRVTDRSNSEHYRNYRLAVKNRLNAPRQREVQEHGRLTRLLDPAELALVHPPPSLSAEDQHSKLHEAYLQLETEYRAVVERLAAS